MRGSERPSRLLAKFKTMGSRFDELDSATRKRVLSDRLEELESLFADQRQGSLTEPRQRRLARVLSDVSELEQAVTED